MATNQGELFYFKKINKNYTNTKQMKTAHSKQGVLLPDL